MEKYFLPYDLSLDFKLLGFNEECIKYYNDEKELSKSGLFYSYDNPMDFVCLAPLIQQAKEWLREKYKIQIVEVVKIGKDWDDNNTYYQIIQKDIKSPFKKYLIEEAIRECVKIIKYDNTRNKRRYIYK